MFALARAVVKEETPSHLFSSVLFRKHLLALGVCVCVAVDFHFSILHPIVFPCIVYLHRAGTEGWMMFYFVLWAQRFTVKCVFLCELRTIFRNCKRKWKKSGSIYSASLANRIANQSCLGAQSIMHISHFRTLFFLLRRFGSFKFIWQSTQA